MRIWNKIGRLEKEGKIGDFIIGEWIHGWGEFF